MGASNVPPRSLPREHSASDEDLVKEIVGGERALFAVLMRRYNQRLFRAVRSIVRGNDDAEDVVQQSYLQAFDKLHQFRGDARFSTWLTRIALNEALGRIRRETRKENVHLDPAESSLTNEDDPTPETETYQRELATVLEREIDRLPETLRIVFVMRDVEELSTAETAQCLALREEAVRVRLHRARKLLQERLTEIAGASPQAFRFDGERCDRIVAHVAVRCSLADR